MLWKCFTQYERTFGKLGSGHRIGKGQFSFQSQRKAMPKNVQTTTQLYSFHAQMGTIKDINGEDRTEASDKQEAAQTDRRAAQKRPSRPRWPRRHGHSPRARYPGVWVKGALGSITTNKASGGDGIPAELFKVLKDDAVKVLHSICQQISKTQQWPQDWKKSVFISILNKGNTKECSNYHTIAFIR